MIVDTNALLIPGEFGVDIFEELERLGYVQIIVPRIVLKELERLRDRLSMKGKEKKAAQVGYSLIQKYAHISEQERRSLRCTVSIEEGEREGGREKVVEEADDMIVALAVKKKAAVLTNDEELKDKLTQAGIVTVYLRGKNRLVEGE